MSTQQYVAVCCTAITTVAAVAAAATRMPWLLCIIQIFSLYTTFFFYIFAPMSNAMRKKHIEEKTNRKKTNDEKNDYVQGCISAIRGRQYAEQVRSQRTVGRIYWKYFNESNKYLKKGLVFFSLMCVCFCQFHAFLVFIRWIAFFRIAFSGKFSAANAFYSNINVVFFFHSTHDLQADIDCLLNYYYVAIASMYANRTHKLFKIQLMKEKDGIFQRSHFFFLLQFFFLFSFLLAFFHPIKQLSTGFND